MKTKALVRSGASGRRPLRERLLQQGRDGRALERAARRGRGRRPDRQRLPLGPTSPATCSARSPTSTRTAASRRSSSRRGHGSLRVRTGGGTIGTVDLSWSLNKESDVYLALYGTQGTLFLGWKESRYRQDGNSVWVPFGGG
jgi:hypothetical protein